MGNILFPHKNNNPMGYLSPLHGIHDTYPPCIRGPLINNINNLISYEYDSPRTTEILFFLLT